MRGGLSWAALGVAVMWPSPAGASGRAVDVELSAPPGCIDATAFRGRLAALPASGLNVDPPRSASVHIFQHDATYTGQLQVILGDGTTTMRQVASPHCGEVTDALELVAALALGLESAPTSFVQAMPAEPPPTPSPHTEPQSPPRRQTVVSFGDDRILPRPVEPTRAARWRFLGGVEASLLAGYGPAVEVAPTVLVGALLDTPDLLAPTLELRGSWSTSEGVVRGSTATITLLQGAVDGCPIRLMLGAGFALRPCAELEVGVFSGTASGPFVATSAPATQTWVALAPLARVEWYVGKLFLIEANGGPAVPLFRNDSFFFSPPTPPASVYTVPNVAAVVRLGVAVQLP